MNRLLLITKVLEKLLVWFSKNETSSSSSLWMFQPPVPKSINQNDTNRKSIISKNKK